MKVFLDDDFEDRRPPDGTWVRAATAAEAIRLLSTGQVAEISFDNDLGDGVPEGHTVLDWIEERMKRIELPVRPPAARCASVMSSRPCSRYSRRLRM